MLNLISGVQRKVQADAAPAGFHRERAQVTVGFYTDRTVQLHNMFFLQNAGFPQLSVCVCFFLLKPPSSGAIGKLFKPRCIYVAMRGRRWRRSRKSFFSRFLLNAERAEGEKKNVSRVNDGRWEKM